MTLQSALRQWKLAAPLAAYRRLDEAERGNKDAVQLEALNRAWRESLNLSPWARALRDQLGLPESFTDWRDFAARVPVIGKAELRAAVEAGSREPAPKSQWRSTGGTTAQPFRFPVFESETRIASLDIWLGRQRLGVGAGDRLFLIWGHSHLFGSGWRGRINAWRRRLSDAALGYTRWSAYRLSQDDLRQAGEALMASRSRYVIGYSSALDRFARVNEDRAEDFARLGLKTVIATAEGFPRADSRALISRVLGCPAVMEYGCVETGPMAYEQPGAGYGVFWRHHRLELDAEGAVVVTSLFPRALPLLRYRVGDLAASDETGPGLIRIASIGGRCNDAVPLPDGAPIHSEAFTHAVRDTPGVLAYQIVRHGAGAWPSIRYEAAAEIAGEAEAALRRRLALIAPGLEGIELEKVAALPASVAGKHRMVVDADEAG
jgi:phenylacetate-coenzyme A ligase PaaK-like adenylate-forming protein